VQVLWECGGTLAAPAITGATIHKAMAFIAPKLVGGVRAPTPVGELGNVEMTQVGLGISQATHQLPQHRRLWS
jgi:diaminohydroxyphosphoribosylaminopyrimidine deaminase / 5-amino-6-(5-phosphoribosylamino)uracil reductase